MDNTLVKTHVFTFNQNDNSGEALSIITEFHDNGDKEIFTNQRIELQSYFNSASINLYGIGITSDALRELANQLDRARIEAQAIMSIDDNQKEIDLYENYGGD